MQRVLKVLSCFLLTIIFLLPTAQSSMASSVSAGWGLNAIEGEVVKSTEIAFIHHRKWFERSPKREPHLPNKKEIHLNKGETHFTESIHHVGKPKNITVDGKLFEIVNGRPQLGRVQVEIDPSLLKNSLNNSLKVGGGLIGLGITADLAKGLYTSYLGYRAKLERSGEPLNSCEPILIRLADSDTIYKIYDPKSCSNQSNVASGTN